MALIIEDGSLVAGANSYVTVLEFRYFAQLRNKTLPTVDSDCEVLLVLATDYLESLGSRFKGYKANSSQTLQWPRNAVYDVNVPGDYVSNSTIPGQLKIAQCLLAIEAQTVSLLPNSYKTDVGRVVRKRIEGVVDTQYETAGSPSAHKFLEVDRVLEPLMSNAQNLVCRRI